MGLSFSVPEGIKIPSSLVNIFKELQEDVGCKIPSHGNLERWAIQVNFCLYQCAFILSLSHTLCVLLGGAALCFLCWLYLITTCSSLALLTK
jgi:hypothetical protein